MNITETSADGLKREYKVVVDKQDIETRILGRLERLKMTARLPGFRPGKVPESLLRQRFGSSIRGEVLEEALTQTSAQALAEQGVRPVMQPTIADIKFDDGEDLEYTMAIEMMPDIVPKDFRELTLTRQTAEVRDEDVEGTLARIAASHKEFVAVEKARQAKTGDALVIDFVGKIDGVAFDGGSGTDHLIELGSNTFVPGFEDQLVGAKPGDGVEVKVTFPEEYGNAEVAGKEAVFAVDIKELRTVELAVADDEFAKNHGFADLEDMRAKGRQQIERDFAAMSRSKLKRFLLDALADDYDFPVPQGMLDIEFDGIWQRVSEAKEKALLDESDIGRSDDELRAEYRAIAERRVRLGLLLSEVGRLNNITVESDELNRAVMEQARVRPGQEDKVVQYFRDNPEALNELRAPLLEDKVVDFILEMATIEDVVVTADELMRNPEDEVAPADDDTVKKGAKKKGAKRKKAAKEKK